MLKENPRGMTVSDVSRAMGMNRNSVAKYLEVLMSTGRVDMKNFGPSKVYYISQRVPISAMLSVTSDYVVVLNKDRIVLYTNDKFLELISRNREDVAGQCIDTRLIPVLSDPDFQEELKQATEGKEAIKEICIEKRRKSYYFKTRFIPTVLEDGEKGMTVILEDITERKKAEIELKKARDDLEKRVAERTAELVQANKALEEEINRRKRSAGLSDALNGINLTINSTLDFNEIIKRVVIVSAVALKCETAIIAIRGNDRWVIRHTHGFIEDHRGREIPDEAFLKPLNPLSPLPVIVSDTDSTAMRHFGIKSSIIVPLVLKNELAGIIILGFISSSHTFTTEETDFTRKLGAAVSLSLANARLYEEKTRTEKSLINTA